MTNFDYFDEQMFDMAHRIERFGFTTMSVNSGECSVPGCPCPDNPGPTWTYSIGMLEHEHSESVIVGAPPALAYELIDLAFKWHHRGLSLPLGRDDRITTVDATFTTVPVPDRCWTRTRWAASRGTKDATPASSTANPSSKTTIPRGRDGTARRADRAIAASDAEGTDDHCAGDSTASTASVETLRPQSVSWPPDSPNLILMPLLVPSCQLSVVRRSRQS
jgi:hypothetical protein